MKLSGVTLPRFCWALVFIVCTVYYGKWGKEAYNFYGDAMGYYLYLPSTFIYHNHKSLDTLPKDRGIRPFIHGYVGQIGQRTPKGYALNQYTYGVALMEAPFFFVAHAYDKMTGGWANGFSEPYQLSVMFSTWFYGALGLWLTYRILRRRYSSAIASITTALLLLGTNLFWFTVQQYGMAHVPLFFLFALLTYLTILVHETGHWKYFAALGFTGGLITVIRPMDGLCVLIPLFYINGRPFVKAKVDFLLKHWLGVMITGVCFLLPIIPQLLYWKWLTGYSVYDSYGPNQKFDFLHSHVWDGLFGASNGWLFYTPLMLLAILGLMRVRRVRPFALCIPLFLVLYVYGIYAWYIPNYINGLGSRPMVDAYALLAIPLAAFIEWVMLQKVVVRVAATIVIIAFTFININYSILQVLGNIWSQDSKYVYNFKTFFHYHLTYNDLVLWDIGEPQPNEKQLKEVRVPYCTRIADSSLSAHVVIDSNTAGQKAYKMSGEEEYAPLAIIYPYSDSLSKKSLRWIKCSGRFMSPEQTVDIYRNHLMVVQIKRGNEVIKWYGIRIDNKVGLLEESKSIEGEPALGYFRKKVWGTVSCYIPVPAEIRVGDYVSLDIWNIGKKPIYISKLCVGFFN